MINPANMIKLMSAKQKFTNNHPRFEAFVRHVFSSGIEEGTVVELTVTKPGGSPVTANIRVQASDLELMEELNNLMSELR